MFPAQADYHMGLLGGHAYGGWPETSGAFCNPSLLWAGGKTSPASQGLDCADLLTAARELSQASQPHGLQLHSAGMRDYADFSSLDPLDTIGVGNQVHSNLIPEEFQQPAGGKMSASAPEFVPGYCWGGSLSGVTPMAQDAQGVPSFGLPPMSMPFVDPFASPLPAVNINGSLDLGSSMKLPYFADSPKVPSPSLAKLLNLEDDVGFGLPQGVPQLPSGPLPSPGSAGHGTGECKPCAFLHTKGCANAETCQFCHLCDPEEKKRRKREKRLGSAQPAVVTA